MVTKFAVTAQIVLDALELDEADVGSKAIVERFIDRAITIVENELGVIIGKLSGTEGSKTLDIDKRYEPGVVALAGLFCICRLTAGPSVGLTLNAGDVNIGVDTSAPALTIFQAEVDRLLKGKKIGFRKGEATP